MDFKKALLGILLLSLMVLGVRANESGPTSIIDYRPHWQVGDNWAVEVTKLTEQKNTPYPQKKFIPRKAKIVYELNVEKEKTIEDEPCFQVNINLSSIDGKKVSPERCFRIFVRKDDYTLKTVQRLWAKDLKVTASFSFERGPVNATDWAGILPIDFPFFDPNSFEYEPETKIISKKIKKRKTHLAFQKCGFVEKTINNKKQATLNIILEEKLDLDDGEMKIIRHTSQIWIKGLPWWIEAVHKQNGKEWCTAKLITVNGEEIVSSPKTQSSRNNELKD